MWEFLRDINARGVTIILTTHYLEEAESLCREIAIIDKGAIIERDRMRNLLRRLNIESFVLNTRQPLLETPLIPEFTVRRIDEHTLEVDVRKEQNLNDLFARLSSLDIEVLSLRNKVNRLEEVFMRLVDNRGANGG
jgi:ABC-2 type transport system ATP-binding protein